MTDLKRSFITEDKNGTKKFTKTLHKQQVLQDGNLVQNVGAAAASRLREELSGSSDFNLRDGSLETALRKTGQAVPAGGIGGPRGSARDLQFKSFNQRDHYLAKAPKRGDTFVSPIRNGVELIPEV